MIARNSECFPKHGHNFGIYTRNTLCPGRIEVIFLLIAEMSFRLPATDVTHVIL